MKTLLAVTLFLHSGLWLSSALGVGDQVPDFRLRSGDNQEISRSDIRTSIVVCFYEDRDHTEVNQTVKVRLEAWQRARSDVQTEQVFVLAVADCRDATWPWIGLWEQALRSKSRELGRTLYGDWDGAMAASFGFTPKVPYLVVWESRGGTITYLQAGPSNPETVIERLHALLSQ